MERSPVVTDHRFHEEFIPFLARKLRVRSYLELGVWAGPTLVGVYNEMLMQTETFRCIGVDIDFPQPLQGPELYCMKSQQFLRDVLPGLDLTFDMVFIDADHSYLGSRADFMAVLPYVRDQGIILLHDTYPENEAQTVPGYCGDTYLLAQQINVAWKDQCEAMTLPVAPGLTLVRKRAAHLPWVRLP